MSEVFDYCHVAEQTDRGCKRPANEDWLAHFESPNGLVAVVCDGMGGHVGGQVASHVAVDAIRRFMMQEHAGTPSELIVEAINVANDAILNRAAQQPELTGMGSTCVMLIVREGKVYMGSVGDSRIYLVRNHRIRQLTVDQSYVQMLVDAGTITKEEAEHHPRKNEITNALGLRNMKPATVLQEAINPEAGDCFLLCSDGLSGMVSDRDICKIVSRQGEMSQQARVSELIERAKRNGGLDNITCQIVEFSVTPGTVKKVRSTFIAGKKKMLAVCCAAVLVLLVAGGLAWWLSTCGEDAHSKTVAVLIEASDTTINLDSVKFEKGKVFAELKETKGLGVKLRYARDLDNVSKSYPGYTLAGMEIHPQESISKESETDGEDQVVRVKFDGELADGENEVAITLYGVEDGKPMKSKMLLLVPVVKPQPADEAATVTEKVPEREKSVDNKKLSESGRSLVVGNDSSSVRKTPELQPTPPELPECTFVLTENHRVFTLHSTKGTNTATDAYFPDWAFDNGGIMSEQDKGWYTISNDCSKCVLRIKHMPKGKTRSVIEIPTNDANGVKIKVTIKKGK